MVKGYLALAAVGLIAGLIGCVRDKKRLAAILGIGANLFVAGAIGLGILILDTVPFGGH